MKGPTKIEKAQDIIQELYNMEYLPAKDDPRVKRKARLSSEVLESEYMLMIRAYNARTRTNSA